MNFLSHTCKHRINKNTCVLLGSKCIKRRFFKSETCALQVQIDPPKMPEVKTPKPEGPKNRDINECNCDGCEISRDPNQGYQPCFYSKCGPIKKGTPYRVSER